MWKDILKSPYKIHSTTFDALDDSPIEDYVHTYSKLFQGTQGEEDTGYWTPSLEEALVYALFGSTSNKLKFIAKPRIKQALNTTKDINLERDDEFDSQSLPRGRSRNKELKYRYLSDDRVKQLNIKLRKEIVDRTVSEEIIDYIWGAVDYIIQDFDKTEEKKLISHIDEILEEDFR